MSLESALSLLPRHKSPASTASTPGTVSSCTVEEVLQLLRHLFVVSLQRDESVSFLSDGK